ncbi:MAG: asparagine synthase (glutamine-hydrolyzing) [Planctomycetaceae bacterium]
MCGILGIAGRTVDEPSLAAWADTMRHRGPDAAGTYTWHDGGFAHRRLQILDTSSAANQPLEDPSGRAVVIFNGEIYNHRDLRAELGRRGHRFRTQSDTEVLLAGYFEWGTRVVEQLHGMFAFAIHDTRDDSVFIARDRLGKKPLFLAELPRGGLIFASELKPILASGLVDTAIDHEAILDFVHLNYILSPKTPLSSVRQLPAAHCGVWKRNRFSSGPYWNLADQFLAGPVTNRHDDDLIDELEALLADATRIRLNSDVPLGAFLSGGLDSTTVVGLMRRFRKNRLHTFSIEFEAEGYDESPHSRAAADFLRTEHHPQLIADDVCGVLPEFARRMDVPLGDDSSLSMYLLAKMSRNDVTVALTGDGADELFAGYDTYHADWLRRYLHPFRGPARVGLDLLSRMVPESGAKRSRRFRIEQFRRGLSGTEADAHYRWREVSEHGAITKYGGLGLQHASLTYSPRHAFRRYFHELKDASWLDRALYVDMKTWLVDDILVKIDRTSMAASVECRSPFLDHRVVEFAARLPTHLKMRGLSRKYAVRQVARRFLPAEMVDRRKSGFNSPTEFWMRGILRDIVEETLGGGALERFGFDWRGGLETSWRRFLAGERRHQYALWGLFMLGLWETHVLREFSCSRIKPGYERKMAARVA